MSKIFESVKNPRGYFVKLTEELSIEQLNEVPPGFNNNIIWNIGHIISAQQGLCYKRAGLEITIDEDFFSRYKSGTKPEGAVDIAGVEQIKELLVSTIDQLETDYNHDIFANYNAFTTRYGVEISNIDDVLRFLPLHEGLHMGYIMALRRVISN